jgi:hypothetical protein
MVTGKTIFSGQDNEPDELYNEGDEREDEKTQ